MWEAFAGLILGALVIFAIGLWAAVGSHAAKEIDNGKEKQNDV